MDFPKDIVVLNYLAARDYLADLFLATKKERTRYSCEAFAEDLSFGRTSYMHQILSGARPLTEKAGRRMADAIPLRGHNRRYFLALVRHGCAKTSVQRDEAFQDILSIRAESLTSDLDRAQLEYFSEWYHPVVRELVMFADFSPDPVWMANRIKPSITTSEAAHSFQLLQRIGYIQFDAGTGRWIQTQSLLSMPKDVRSLALMRYHQKVLELAKESVVSIPAADREIATLTISLSSDEFKTLKQRVQEFRAEIIKDYANSKTTDEIVQFNLQLFPMTERGKE